MVVVFSFILGSIFGLGPITSGMVNPAKVQNFLDLFGTWDPILALLMSGAIAVTAPRYTWLYRHRKTPYFSDKFRLPDRTQIERKLLLGSAVFGIGWGLGGFCPGPGPNGAAHGGC